MRLLSFQKIILFVPVLMLGACGYAIESSNQDITFLTPEAMNARCDVYVDSLKYQVYPPQTRNIKKSEKDMIIRCSAPGNRVSEMTVPSKISTRAIWGTPVGIAWDYASDSLFSYPDVIAIDFTGEEVRPNSPPQHNNSDIKQPEEYDLEEFLPNEPRLNSDKYHPEQTIKHRDEGVSSDNTAAPSEVEKGDLQSVIDSVTVDHNDVPAVGAPVQLFPEP